MKKVGIAAAVAAMCFSLSGTAFAANGVYAAIDAGPSFTKSMTFGNYTSSLNTAQRNYANFNTGFNGNVHFGYKSGPLRYEVEGSYFGSAVHQLENTTLGRYPDANGKMRVAAGLLNVYYDFDAAGSPWVAYMGGGLGYARIHTNLNTSGTSDVIRASTRALAYQGMLGLKYFFNDHLAAILGYKYFSTAKTDYAVKDSAGVVINDVRGQYRGHNVVLGLAYHFV